MPSPSNMLMGAQPFLSGHSIYSPHHHPLPLPLPPPWMILHYSSQLHPHHKLSIFYSHPQPPPTLSYYYTQPPLLQVYGGEGGGGTSFFSVTSGGAKAEIEEVVERKEVGARVKTVFRGKFRRSTKRRVSTVAVWKVKNKPNSVHLPPPPRHRPPSPPFEDHVGKTTVMIKNIPNQYRRHMLLKFLDEHCRDHNQMHSLHLAYDFVYLPMDFRTGDNLGYAFVNFTSSGAALKIKETLNGFKWGFFQTSYSTIAQSTKICEITWARIQGKENLVEHFRNSKFWCENEEYLPAVITPPMDGSATASSPTPIGKCMLGLKEKP